MNVFKRAAAFLPLAILLAAFLLLSLRIGPVRHAVSETTPNPGSWAIHVGDLPLNGLAANDSAGEWKPYPIESRGVMREVLPDDYRGYYWLRFRLPDLGGMESPRLFISGFQHAELYISGERIYEFNTDRPGFRVNKYQHWDLAKLRPEFSGHTAYVRVLQDDADPQPGEFRIVDKSVFYENMLRRDLFRVLFMVVFLFLSAVSFLLWANRRKETIYLYFGILNACAAYGSIGRSYLLLLFTHSDLAVYLQDVAVPVGAFALLGFLGQIYGGGKPHLFRYGAWCNLFFGIVAWIAAFFRADLYHFIIDKMFLLTSVLIMPVVIVLLVSDYRQYRRRESIWVFTGCAAFTLFALLHYIEVNVYPFVGALIGRYPFLYYFQQIQIVFGAFLFVCCFGMVLVLQYTRTHRQVAVYAKELRANNEKLLALDKLKDEFLSRTSHELRTPLYGMIGLAEALADGTQTHSSEESFRKLSLIVASGRRLSRLINDILDHSKIQHQDLSLRRKPVDVRQAAEIVIALLEKQAERKMLAIRNEIPRDLPRAWADEDRLEQIFFNLVGNAIKFTELGKVTLQGGVEGSSIRITVTDTGIGIYEDETDRVFEPFVQGKDAARDASAGTGLGLAVTKQLIEMHGGEVSLKSKPGEGTQVTLTLPIWEKPLEEETSGELRIGEAEESGFGGSTNELAERIGVPPLILLVDDERMNLEVLASQLEPDYRIVGMQRAAEALSWLDAHPDTAPDLIIADIMMPEMNGYEFSGKVRERYSEAELPILLLTAQFGPDPVHERILPGVNDYLMKPISRQELLTRVHVHLRLTRLNRSLEQEVQHRTAELEETNLQLQLSMNDTIRAMEEIAVLEERNRIAHRVHDTVGHTLTASIMQLEAVKRLFGKDPTAALDKLDTAQSVLRGGLESIRGFLHQLKEDGLQNELAVSLHQLIASARETADIEIDAHIGSMPDVGPLHKKVIFHALQEGLTNGMKHGGGTRFEFTLLFHEKVLHFSLRNNGAPYVASPFGLGLSAIRELTAQLGGTLQINAALPDWGCEIKLRLPFSAA
ncbi:ATP-binding protein [Cohnella candidum]|uniref:Circadian input-output histidine kinase CikA n=1 Tax=Cohnella candidum TaxID=2674991 RepID=A0A3G3JYN6_9BACL|nr:ATP-binding protein [Cohnella candidum]AYQ73354.1 response regulator [Cohnella candidum]